MKRAVIVAAILAAGGSTVVLAQGSAFEQRDKIMTGVGAAAKTVGPMMKGEAPFDLVKVKAALAVYIDAAKKMPALFPDDSKTAPKTRALPAIWEKKAEFNAGFVKFGADSEAALIAIKDDASLKTEWPKVVGNCGGCHKPFKNLDK